MMQLQKILGHIKVIQRNQLQTTRQMQYLAKYYKYLPNTKYNQNWHLFIISGVIETASNV